MSQSPAYELRLADGRTIRLEQLFQYRTYWGLDKGRPGPQRDERAIQSAVRYAELKLWGGGQPHLVEPTAPVGELPGVACLGLFLSDSPARDASEGFSYLKIVWFQEAFALPVAPVVVERLQAVDWNRLANDTSE